MSTLKVALAITLSTVGVGSGVAFGVASLAPENEAKVVEASSISSMAKLYRFTNNKNWDNVYVHVWGSSNASNNTSWPGNKLSQSKFEMIPSEFLHILLL